MITNFGLTERPASTAFDGRSRRRRGVSGGLVAATLQRPAMQRRRQPSPVPAGYGAASVQWGEMAQGRVHRLRRGDPTRPMAAHAPGTHPPNASYSIPPNTSYTTPPNTNYIFDYPGTSGETVSLVPKKTTGDECNPKQPAEVSRR
jgi:hypothetical protein